MGKAVVENSLIIKARQINDKTISLEIENLSGLPFKMVVAEANGLTMRLRSHLNEFTLDPISQNAITVNSPAFTKGEEYSIKLKVQNVQVASGKPLEYSLKFKL